MFWTSDEQGPQWSGETSETLDIILSFRGHPSLLTTKIGQKYGKNRPLSWGFGTSAPVWGHRCLKIWERRLKEILVLIGEETKKGGDEWENKKDERERRKRKEPWYFKEELGCEGFLNYFGHVQELLSLRDQDKHFPRLSSPPHALHCMQSPTEMKSTKVFYELWNQNGRTLYSLCLYVAEKDYTQHRETRHESHIASAQEIDPCWGIWCCHWQKVSAPSETGGSLRHAK